MSATARRLSFVGARRAFVALARSPAAAGRGPKSSLSTEISLDPLVVVVVVRLVAARRRDTSRRGDERALEFASRRDRRRGRRSNLFARARVGAAAARRRSLPLAPSLRTTATTLPVAVARNSLRAACPSTTSRHSIDAPTDPDRVPSPPPPVAAFAKPLEASRTAAIFSLPPATRGDTRVTPRRGTG